MIGKNRINTAIGQAKDGVPAQATTATGNHRDFSSYFVHRIFSVTSVSLVQERSFRSQNGSSDLRYRSRHTPLSFLPIPSTVCTRALISMDRSYHLHSART